MPSSHRCHLRCLTSAGYGVRRRPKWPNSIAFREDRREVTAASGSAKKMSLGFASGRAR